jgi:hypothetical protein
MGRDTRSAKLRNHKSLKFQSANPKPHRAWHKKCKIVKSRKPKISENEIPSPMGREMKTEKFQKAKIPSPMGHEMRKLGIRLTLTRLPKHCKGPLISALCADQDAIGLVKIEKIHWLVCKERGERAK